MRAGLLGLAILGATIAQTPTPVSVTAADSVGWDYPTSGVPTVIGFLLCLDTTCPGVGLPTPQTLADTTPGAVTYVVNLGATFGANLTPGPHVLKVVAANNSGQVDAATTLAIVVGSATPPPPPPTVTGPPVPPTNTRVIRPVG